ncbi:MAG: dihydropteroate synthase [Nitrospirae bacterium]|nr:dihydropteroate synthase [Nitrospirota bacterium]MBF0535164.1 dihydropteroate synthase [Nitrospirota bacterium]MBF0615217.1 dihydropteroate synthase [Nitrospirota bacterium]
MGVLNVTPDSFSDSGVFFEKNRAIEGALKMVEDGADIIDVGGESTRPGAEQITVHEELKRVIPVIEAITEHISVPISVDTYKAAVAHEALNAGASMVNDISGLRFDNDMAKTIAEAQGAVCIMHILGTPKNMQNNPHYDDIFVQIGEYLNEGINMAKSAGISDISIVIDPGIGFGKTLDHNLQILRGLDRFKQPGKPVMVGTSRKSFISMILGGRAVDKRLMGTAATVAISIFNGASIVRVHDVKEIADVVRVSDAIVRGENH